MRTPREFFCALLAFTVTIAVAQIASAQADIAAAVDKRLGMWTDKLKLTDVQKDKIRPILTDQANQIQKLRGDTSLTPDARRGKMNELSAGLQNQMKGILNPDQLTKWKDVRKEEKAALKAKVPK
jgi:Spy/CpxP family protein refolding chaperone